MREVGACQDKHRRSSKMLLRGDAQMTHERRDNWDSCQCDPVLQEYWLPFSMVLKCVHENL